MADEDLIRVASASPLNLAIQDLPEDEEKPGASPPPRVVQINGNRHPLAVNGLGITEGVPRGMFEAWLDKHQHLRNLMWPLDDQKFEEHQKAQVQFGTDVGLPEHEKAGEGSLITGPVVTAEDMAAVSTTPNDDSPRSQVTVGVGLPGMIPVTPAVQPGVGGIPTPARETGAPTPAPDVTPSQAPMQPDDDSPKSGRRKGSSDT
jgi:hypothetical protein